MNYWTVGNKSNSVILSEVAGTQDELFAQHTNELRRGSPNWFNAGSYGSTNTEVEIQAAIDAAVVAGGGTVFIPAGIWTISNSILITTDTSVGGKIILQGAGMGATTLTLAANRTSDTPVLKAYYTGSGANAVPQYNPYIYVRDLTIDGNGANQTKNCPGVQFLNNLYVGIENVMVKDCIGYAGIFLAGGADADYPYIRAYLKNVYVTGSIKYSGSYGIGFYVTALTSDQVVFDGCWAHGNAGSGFWIEDDASEILIDKCFAVSNGGGIDISGSTDAPGSKRINITDCVIKSNTADGMGISQLVNDLVIANNHVISNGHSGIHLAWGSSVNPENAVLVGNICKNNGQDAVSKSGIQMDFADNCTVIGNHCYDDQDTKTQAYGIEIQGDNNIITENRVNDNLTTNIRDVGAGNMVRNNKGWVTENSGTATVANGATTAVVTHGLAVTPTADDISVTPTNSMGNATKFYIGTFTATQFTITVNADPGATTATFAWKAIVL